MKRDFRWWGSRVGLAVVSPILFLGALEIVVSWLWGPIYYPLPGVEEASHYLHFTLPERFNPLFELREDGDDAWLQTAPDLIEGNAWFVRDQRFPARRAEGGVRVAFMGGSSVQGWPYREDGVVFPELVGEHLRQRFPQRRTDIINAGVGSYSSFQLVDVAWQLTAYKPDVVVVYAGHNDQGYYFFNRDFLDRAAVGGRGSGSIQRFLNRFDFYRGARLLRDRGAPEFVPRSQKETISPETAFLPVDEEDRIHEIGAERYASWVRVQQGLLPPLFEANLHEVITMLQSGGSQVVLAVPVGNLRDFPPPFSLFWDPPSDRAQDRVRDLVREADSAMNAVGVAPRRMPGIEDNGEHMVASAEWAPIESGGASPTGSPEAIRACEEPLRLLEQALAIADGYALAWYLKGTCLLHSDPVAARTALERARDLSPAMAPMQRAGSELAEVVQRVAIARDVPFVDLRAVFAAEAKLGLPGGYFFVDNLHFSAKGHTVAAGAIAEVLGELPVLREGPSSDRGPDPTPDELGVRIAHRAENPRWGQSVKVPGAGEPYLDGTGVYDAPGHAVSAEEMESRRDLMVPEPPPGASSAGTGP